MSMRTERPGGTESGESTAPGRAGNAAEEAGRAPAEAAEGAERATGAGRLPLLDVLRGLAILGTLGMNVWLFAGPGGELGILDLDTPTLASAAADPGAGAVAEALFRLAMNGTSLSLLTLLFGAGLAVQYRSARKRGLPWPGPYKWRALFLFFEGLVHFTLVFAWDVLMGYAVTALVAAWLLARGPRVRVAVAAVAATVHVALMAVATAFLSASSGTAGGGPGGRGPDPELVRLYAEDAYLEQVEARLENFAVLRIEPVMTFGLLLALFLGGVFLFRAGAFSPGTQGRRLRVRMAVWGLGIGVPMKTAASLLGSDWFLIERYVAAPVAAIGVAGLVGLILDRARRTGPVTRALSDLGRVALSGYVFQNLIAMVACYGFGLGMAARFADTGPWWVIALWAAICAVLLAGSALWLRRFRHGPLEAVQKAALAGTERRRQAAP
ncbi:DUF418 domain-containing protein [Nocardiopsis sp. RSe5-2]|uniref:DUF418 domain-containing protein n=1 Tax=Nocardiopsis endophytica TaxID=3018445 RepID=A0ABT4U9Q8_9ACTN|nr:DUF418 domain-containing protein [Nocardiopsis endophytica]MDA2813708.1 DUF418 domain-containing protein [Nocardiopsis endophytica]